VGGAADASGTTPIDPLVAFHTPDGRVPAAGACLAGHAGRNSDFALIAETCNSTGWRAMLRRLAETDAHVICAQEIKRLPKDIDEASAIVLGMGWKSFFAPSCTTTASGLSSGAAIFVRKCLGLQRPPAAGAPRDRGGGPVVVPHRVVAGLVTAPGLKGVVFYAAYFEPSTEWGPVNCCIINAIAHHRLGHGFATAIGADWNMSREKVNASGVLMQIGMRTAPQGDGTWSVVAAGGSSEIDYFAIDTDLGPAILGEKTKTDNVCIKGHRPVQLAFRVTTWRSARAAA